MVTTCVASYCLI